VTNQQRFSSIAGVLFYVSINATVKLWNMALRSFFGGRILGWFLLCLVGLACIAIGEVRLRFHDWITRAAIGVMLGAAMAVVYLCICERGGE
jgi:hypothetical protein